MYSVEFENESTCYAEKAGRSLMIVQHHTHVITNKIAFYFKIKMDYFLSSPLISCYRKIIFAAANWEFFSFA
jgi:hypothetical protein